MQLHGFKVTLLCGYMVTGKILTNGSGQFWFWLMVSTTANQIIGIYCYIMNDHAIIA